MADSGPSLTQFLLDLTEDEELSARFQADPKAVIQSRGLDQFEALLSSGDVPKLRAAVRAEISEQPPSSLTPGMIQAPEGWEPEALIAGVRIPGVRSPQDEPIEGVREPPPDEAVPGVREPPPDSP